MGEAIARARLWRKLIARASETGLMLTSDTAKRGGASILRQMVTSRQPADERRPIIMPYWQAVETNQVRKDRMSEMKLLRFAVIGMCIVQANSAGAQTPAPTAPKAATPAPAAAPPTPAAAAQGKPNDSAAEMTTATFGDWQLRCRKIAAPSAGQPTQACEVIQSVLIQGQNAPFAQLAFGKNAPSEPLMVTAVVPTNVSFPSPLRVSTEENDKQPIELAWTRCLPIGCFASIAPKDDVLKRWRSMNDAGFFVFKNGPGQDLKIPFSFRGLSRALDALAKEG